MRYTFEQYRRLFESAVSKYETVPFFASLIQAKRRPSFPAAPREVAVFGIRHDGQQVHSRGDIADDTISLVRLDSDGLPQVYEYVGTTEPGAFDKLENAQGDFKMLPGLYFFKHGKHHQVNPCLIQDGPVWGERAMKDKIFDLTDDRTWQINDTSLHIHAGIRNVNHVGNWSAGCQVIAGDWGGAPWKEFYKYCEMATNLPIPYVLVHEADVAGMLA